MIYRGTVIDPVSPKKPDIRKGACVITEDGAVFGNAGRIAPGYRFDALVIRDMSDEGTQLSPEESLERFCYIGDDRDILARYADGKLLSYDTLS